MEIEAPLFGVVAQIGGAGVPVEVAAVVGADVEAHAHAPCDGGKRCCAFGKFDPVGTGIVADGAKIGDRLSYLASLSVDRADVAFDERVGGFQCFSGFDAGGAVQLRGQVGIDTSQTVVGGVMESVGIALVRVPSVVADGVKAGGGLAQGLEEDPLGLAAEMQSEFQRRFHDYIVPHNKKG